MLLHRVSVLPDESLIVALLSSLIVALHFPGINWGAARASKLESRRPVSAIRGKPLSESGPP
jgi:hypothetical protein